MGVVAPAEAPRSHTAFVGDLKLAGKYQISDCMAFRDGYQLLWLEGVAVAPEQFDNTNLVAGTATLDTNGSPFYHGAFASIETTR